MKNKISYINLFTNNFRSINVIKLLTKKYKIKNIFLARKNLNLKLFDFIKKKKIKFKIIDKINNNQILKTLKDEETINIVCGFPYFFSSNVIKNSKYPILNCHGGDLPNYRGGSPLSCQIINNEKNIFISTLLISKGIDDGKILLKKKFRLKKNMNILDVQNKANSIFPKLIIQSIELLINKKKLKRQTGKIKVYKQRTPADSFFVPKKTKYLDLRNLHRATFPVYCPPFFLENNKIIFIEKFKLINENKKNINFRNKFYLKLNDFNIVIHKYKKIKFI